MKIREESISHYLDWMRKGQPFAFAGYSDAEWHCVLGTRAGEKTGLGQILCPRHGKRLLDVLRKRQSDEWFLFAIPKVLRTISGFDGGEIDWFLGREDIKIVGWERDVVTDDLAREADLYPLIRQVHDMRPVVLIGNEHLRVMRELCYWEHVPISSPNLHMEPDGIERAVEAALKHDAKVYLVSAGVSAAIIIDQLRDARSASWLIDCGSMWDCFAKVGGQREWRAKLYASPKSWRLWMNYCLGGRPGRLWM